MTMRPDRAAIVVLTPGGFETAARIKRALPDSRIHALRPRLSAAATADQSFSDTTQHLRALFSAGTPIIAVCAAGIAIRALAPLLADKTREPPVVAVAEDGSCAVPLLGGHKGANALARKIAEALGGAAAVTTAGDLRLGLALDEPPAGWRIADPAAVKDIAAALISGAPVALHLDCGDGGWLSQSGIPFAAEASYAIRVTDRAIVPSKRELLFHPPVLAVGVGCERGADPQEAIALVKSAFEKAGLSPLAVACVASLDIKEDEPAVHAAAKELGVPARFFDAPVLEAETPRLANPSDLVFRQTGCHGVAEAAALAAAGPGSELLVPKTKSRRATCAIARAASPIDTAQAGRPRGGLAIVGIGPGGPETLSPEARAAIEGASDLVGYSLYLDLLGQWPDAARHEFALGEEEVRCRAALDLAKQGRQVALISSGDAGIYGLASLALELIDREDDAGWGRIALSVLPGISAMQAAAARIGAPLGHDFCAVSLSDLLTPWPEIERRLGAAAEGDFVVALYNPVSRRRRNQLERARDILLAHRAPATPVVLARNLGRAGESVTVIPLQALSADIVDMLTVVVVGNSRTKTTTQGGKLWVYTPRGYRVGAETGQARRSRP
jgi:cobalt-precorrin 5A hydrolase/precorrin-3B C17-methyltransferase